MIPTISQNVMESKVIGLPAHDSMHTNSTNALTKMPATSVRRVSGEVLRARSAIAVMSLPRPSTVP